MAYIWAAADDTEPVDSSTISAIANIANYAVISGCAQTYSAANMQVTVASGSVLHNGSTVTVAGNTVTLVADATYPRWTWIVVDNTGTADIVSGDPSATPAVPSLDGDVGIGLALIPAAQTIANDITTKLDKRVIEPQYVPLNTSVQLFVEGSGRKGFFGGAASAAATVTAYGLATKVFGLNNSSCAPDGAAGKEGSFLLQTDSNSGDYEVVQGTQLISTADWTMVWRGDIVSAASKTAIIGLAPNGTPLDQNGIIAFRVSGTGNIIGVCDNGGTETTRDTGATGATECTLRIEVREGGTIVRFYKDNVQVGADVTTNIPTAAGYVIAGVSTQAVASKTMTLWDFYGWREV